MAARLGVLSCPGNQRDALRGPAVKLTETKSSAGNVEPDDPPPRCPGKPGEGS
jgi:hypothetical protein